MLLKFLTLRYNNVNSASKTKVKKSFHWTFLFILLLEKTVKNPIR